MPNSNTKPLALNVRLPKELLKALDVFVEKKNNPDFSRSDAVREILREKLKSF